MQTQRLRAITPRPRRAECPAQHFLKRSHPGVGVATVYRYFGTKERMVLWDEYDPMLLAHFDARSDLGLLEAAREAIRVRRVANVSAIRHRIAQPSARERH